MPKAITGVYRLLNIATGLFYVGGAYESFAARELWHRRALRAGYHFNTRLQRAWNKYGEEAFVFEILERCSPKKVAGKEQKWLDRCGAGDRKLTYNLSPFAAQPPSAKGRKRSEETKSKMSKALKGNHNSRGFRHSQEARDRMSESAKLRMANPVVLAASLEKLHTPEVHQKIGVALAEYYDNPEARKACSARSKLALNRPEVKEKISRATEKQWTDPETRGKMLDGIHRANADPAVREKRAQSIQARLAVPENMAALVSRNQSEEHRRKVSEGMLGHAVSEETKRKLSQKAKAQWERLREEMVSAITEANQRPKTPETLAKLSSAAKTQPRKDGKFAKTS